MKYIILLITILTCDNAAFSDELFSYESIKMVKVRTKSGKEHAIDLNRLKILRNHRIKCVKIDSTDHHMYMSMSVSSSRTIFVDFNGRSFTVGDRSDSGTSFGYGYSVENIMFGFETLPTKSYNFSFRVSF